MAKLFGMELSKRQLLERVGHISQIAGINRYRLEEGRKDSVLAFDMKNGCGFDITIMPGRAMDISYASYKGIPLAWISKCGLSSPMYYEEPGLGWLRNFSGGLLTTCGLTYAGAPCVDNGEELGIHGRISNIQADEICARTLWDGDDFTMSVSGKVIQANVFGENLQLMRTITMKMGENRLYIDDDIENLGFSESPFMIIYHMNFGFPLVDKGTKFYVTSDDVECADEESKKHMDTYNILTEPLHGIKENVFYHKCYGDQDNFGHCTLINNNLNIGVSLSFNTDELCNLTEWKMMGQGDYVLGMEPCNCKTLGRAMEREQGTLKFINPGEIRHMHIVVDILDGRESIDDNLKYYK